MFRTLDFSLQKDLGQYSRLLWQHKISHRIVEHEGRQVLLVYQEAQIPEAMSLYQRWENGEASFAEDSGAGLGGYFRGGDIMAGSLRAFLRSPLTITLIAACIVLAFLAPLSRPTGLTWALLFPDFSYGTRIIILSRVIDNFTLTQFLQMLSPILLHAGPLHLVFNMLWLLELGKRIETVQSSIRLALVIVLLGLVSNTAQYLYGGGNNFGGMSGVVFGLFGYIWLWQLVAPRAGLNLPPSLIGFMLLSLVIMTVLQLNFIANEAHLGGFLAGVVLGGAGGAIYRWRHH